MVIIDIVINTLLGGLTLDPAGMHCLSWDDAFYWQDTPKRQTVGTKFTHRPKIRVFAPQGRLVAPIHVKLGRADGLVGPLGCAKFHLYRHRGMGMRLQKKYQKFPLFGKESPTGATPLTDFENI